MSVGQCVATAALELLSSMQSDSFGATREYFLHQARSKRVR